MTSASQRLTPVPPSSRTAGHRAAVTIAIGPIAEFLIENLGAPLVGMLVSKDTQTVRRWATRSDRRPRIDSEGKLRAAYQVFQELLPVESSATIRAWFMGMNPQLGDQSPIEAIAEGKSKQVMAAARSFVSGG